MLAFLLFGSFCLLLASGAPIFAALGLSGILTIYFAGLSMDAVPINVNSAINTYSLLAVPMFILTGVIIERSGIAKRLLALSASIVGNGPGALAVTVVVLAIMMGGISGSSAAIAAMIGGIMTSSMVRAGYPRPFIASVVTVSASTDILVPPSVTLIVYTIMVPEASLPEVFTAGIIPGTLCGLALIVPVYTLARIHGFGSEDSSERPPFWRSLKEASLGLFAKVVILGGLRVGLFTPTETGVVAVCYAAFLGCVVYRTMKWRDIYKSAAEAAELTGVIMIILAFTSVFAWALSTIGVIDPIVTWIVNLPIGPYGVLAVITVALVIAGIFLDGLPIFVIFLPIVIPIAKTFGWDLVWFGIIMTFMILIGAIIPPLSTLNLIGARIANTPVEATTGWVAWMIPSVFLVLFAVIVFPEIALWLPRVTGMGR